MIRSLTASAAVAAALTIAAPAHAAMTSDQYTGLHMGETKHAVAVELGDHGTLLRRDTSGLVTMVWRAYATSDPCLVAVLSYSQDASGHYRLTGKAVTQHPVALRS